MRWTPAGRAAPLGGLDLTQRTFLLLCRKHYSRHWLLAADDTPLPEPDEPILRDLQLGGGLDAQRNEALQVVPGKTPKRIQSISPSPIAAEVSHAAMGSSTSFSTPCQSQQYDRQSSGALRIPKRETPLTQEGSLPRSLHRIQNSEFRTRLYLGCDGEILSESDTDEGSSTIPHALDSGVGTLSKPDPTDSEIPPLPLVTAADAFSCLSLRDLLDDLTCPICLSAFEHPYATECMHRFCKVTCLHALPMQLLRWAATEFYIPTSMY